MREGGGGFSAAAPKVSDPISAYVHTVHVKRSVSRPSSQGYPKTLKIIVAEHVKSHRGGRFYGEMCSIVSPFAGLWPRIVSRVKFSPSGDISALQLAPFIAPFSIAAENVGFHPDFNSDKTRSVETFPDSGLRGEKSGLASILHTKNSR